ncbi:uncharacterized protein LOC133313294 [Gastrolobium bilobum]|uniref:uncharacterized protein LOC133313294 n=1 Tax=Gastrolobium bilobum TaxID=150636 RepID=UPI002AB1658C|nr:uncharacterized protein LOC133313294 [Gastrolobium bilobum]
MLPSSLTRELCTININNLLRVKRPLRALIPEFCEICYNSFDILSHLCFISLLPGIHGVSCLVFEEKGNQMHEFSTVDGFLEISECMAEMIKYVANEPSVGLFFIQHHAQNAVPNVNKVNKNLVEKSHETSLHTEDLEDSVMMVRSMKDCGFPIADEMIGEIKKSLVTMTTKQPKKGLIHPSASISQTERASFWGNSAFYPQEGNEKRSNYFSNVLKSAKQKATSLKWPQSDAKGSIDSEGEKPQMMYPNLPLSVTSVGTATSLQDTETDELPLSSHVEDESQQEQTDDISVKLLSVSEIYDDFKANKEAKLEEWLEGTSNLDDNCGTGNEERC